MIKKKEIIKVTNIFNTGDKKEQEIKEIFNKKFLKTIYQIEKNEFYDCNNEKKNDIMNLVENANYFIG